MPPCSPKKSNIHLNSNYWENFESDRGYEGHYQFNEDQFYEGEFFRGSFHGRGTYKWQNVAVYEGGLYSNFKEGYGSLSFPDGSYFENNDSNSDILSNRSSKHFSTPYSSLIYDPRSVFFDRQIFEKAYFVKVKELSKKFLKSYGNWENAVKLSGEINNLEEERNTDTEKFIPLHCRCTQEVFEMKYKEPDNADVCERESFKGELEIGVLGYFTKFGAIDELDRKSYEENVLECESFGGEEEEEEEAKCFKILSWNRSALCTEMLKQIYRYRAFEERLNFNLGKLMIGDRTAFRKTGEKEMQCVHFLKMCSLGPVQVVKDLLCTYEISEELMDARGNNSLMFAAATDQHDVIDILLDHGVDVNTFNDESLTPLNLCLLRRLAQTEEISNWETAFLPKEIDQNLVPEYPLQPERQSIPSLDRVFGDGMSIFDSKSLDQKFLTNFSMTSVPKETDENFQRARDSDESTDVFNLSEITILNIPKSPGTYSLFPGGSDDGARLYRRSTTLSFFHEFSEIHRKNISNEPTPKLNVIPKSNKRHEFEESIKISAADKYLFKYFFDKSLDSEDIKKDNNSAKKSNKAEDKNNNIEEIEGTMDSQLIDKLNKIDKTIEKLLQRGADPNLSEVPKPSIHLGVHTKDLNIVFMLLQHGANPDCHLYSNEGLLTPLHVLVLQKPALEYVDICDLLLNFGANPEKETTPEFAICEEEKKYLDLEHGRTPLQLLCMRPDLEFGDPNEYLIAIGLMLAKVCNVKRFYNGHTYLTLAMLCGNMKLLKALLESGRFDSNEILEKNRGTSLHFLVSTELQKRTSYDSSIKMCDLLIENEANPLKEVPNLGTCVDYGRREIEEEKQARKVKTVGNKDVKTEKNMRDHIKDHEKVVDYLSKIASDMSTKKKAPKQSGRSEKTQDSLEETFRESSIKGGGKTGRKTDEDKDDAEQSEDTERKGKKQMSVLKELQETGQVGKGQKEKKENERPAEIKTKNLKKRLKDQKHTTNIKKEKIKKDLEKRTEKFKNKKPEAQTKRDKIGQGKKDLNKPCRRTDSNLQRTSKASFKTGKCIETCSETFPENQRQLLLRMFGNCTNIDINEFLVPYVVLRDGEMYYRFQGNVTQSKEQYSLI